MRQLKPKIAHFIRFNVAKFKFRYLVRYRFYILPFFLVLSTVIATTAAVSNPYIKSLVENANSTSKVLGQEIIRIAILILMTIGTSLYFWIDYRQHNAPLKQADPLVQYSFRHHLKVVTLPLLRFKWRPLAYAMAVSTLTIFAMVGTLFVTMRNVQAAVTGEIVINKTNENIGYYRIGLDGTKTYIPFSRTSNLNAYGGEYYDKVSPTGALIASTGTLRNPGIQIIRTDGSGFLTITPTPYTGAIQIEDWHPNEQKILFIMSNDIYVADLNTQSVTNLTNDSSSQRYSADWSPDGSKILYRQVSGYRLMDPDGSNKLAIPTITTATTPKWSPDSLKVAQISSTALRVYTVATNATSSYTISGISSSTANQFEWTSNTQLVFLGKISTRDHLFTINSDNTSKVQKTSEDRKS
ncbi:MAG: hypothetical protein QG628_547, partial [Patescibacteria group bacterium]|nr:hypothetical protein [Patescibacteria group bacterium]